MKKFYFYVFLGFFLGILINFCACKQKEEEPILPLRGIVVREFEPEHDNPASRLQDFLNRLRDEDCWNVKIFSRGHNFSVVAECADGRE